MAASTVLGLLTMLVFAFINTINIDFTVNFIKMVICYEFIAKSTLMNINFGYILSYFLDTLHKFDVTLDFEIMSETVGTIGGKFDQYNTPRIMLNAQFISLTLYLVSCIAKYAISFAIKNDKASPSQKRLKLALQKVGLLIYGLTVIGNVFYSNVEIKNFVEVGTDAGFVSLAVVALTMIFIIIDTIKLLKIAFVPRSFNISSHAIEMKFNTHHMKLEADSNKLDARSQPELLLNPIFVLHFIFLHYVFVFSYNQPTTKVWLILVSTIIRSVYSIYILLTRMDKMKSKPDSILSIVVEVCLTAFITTYVSFHNDPNGLNLSSDFSENLQMFDTFVVALLVLVLITKLILSVKIEFQAKSKTEQVYYIVQSGKQDAKKTKKFRMDKVPSEEEYQIQKTNR
jgi:hypothetical protein